MKDATLVTTLGRDPEAHHGIVNPPIYRASTVLRATLDTYEKPRSDREVAYGRYGTPTSMALEDAVAQLEGGYRAVAVGSGKTAIAAVMLALLESGDHVLVTDNAYGPTRRLADGLLKKFGVETTYFDPTIGAEIERLFKSNTRLVFTESPGSLTFEMQDIPAIAEVARAHGAIVMTDNTWASPLYYKPFEHGADVSIQAATKYIGGHSDLMMGIVTTTEALWPRVRHGVFEVATASAPDDCYLAMRGLRTLATRLQQHWRSGVEVAQWLRQRPEVARVMHPALPEDPGHDLWRRDYLGACGLFGFVLKPGTRAQLAALLDDIHLFGMGASWGGYESLLIPSKPAPLRSAVPWREEGQLMRVHVGLEDPSDLIAELERAFARFNAAA